MPSTAVKFKIIRWGALLMQVAAVLCMFVPIGTLTADGRAVNTLQAAVLYGWSGNGLLGGIFFLALCFVFPALAWYVTLCKKPRTSYFVCALIAAGEAISASCFFTAIRAMEGHLLALSSVRYGLVAVLVAGMALYIAVYLAAWDGN